MLGPIFDMFGWKACVAGIAVALVIAALLAIFLKTPMAPGPMDAPGLTRRAVPANGARVNAFLSGKHSDGGSLAS